MKLYKHIPKKIIRVEFLKRGDKCRNLMFSDSTSEQVIEFIKKELSKKNLHVNPLVENKVQIRCFEAEGKVKTNHKAITVHGINVDVLHKIIETASEKL